MCKYILTAVYITLATTSFNNYSTIFNVFTLWMLQNALRCSCKMKYLLNRFNISWFRDIV